MTISAAIRGTLTRTAGVIALTLALISPAGITGGLMGQQNSQPGQQQNCPAQGTQNNGQQGQQSQEGQQNGANNGQNNNCNQPAPLFGGALSIKKSNQTTDSAALGFNGVDPNGQVQQAFLNSAPSADSEKKAEARRTGHIREGRRINPERHTSRGRRCCAERALRGGGRCVRSRPYVF
jgi:hypothetical protein